MKKRSLYLIGGAALIGLIAAVAVVAIMIAGGVSGSGRNATINDGTAPDPSAPNVVQERAPGNGAQEGIAVHGHWTVEVREADGRLVQRNEFENAFTFGGKFFLTGLLTRSFGLPAWGILLHTNVADTGPCDTTLDGVGQDCLIREASAGGGLTTWPNVTQFTTLTVSNSGGATQALTLTGTANATANGSIDVVQSLVCYSNPPSVDPSVCNNGDNFTSKALASPVALLTGQQVLVTVTITFS